MMPCGILTNLNQTTLSARVLASFGTQVLVRLADGEPRLARPLGRDLEILCGDHVQLDPIACDPHLVTAVGPRHRCLRRSNLRGRSEALLANHDQLAIVLACTPRPDLFLIDRYLSAAESAQTPALLILNKADLSETAALRASLQCLEQLNYPVLEVSAIQADSLAGLRAILQQRCTAFVGQSGVGKSSLLRALATDAQDAEVGALMKTAEGRHTTTTARLYRMDEHSQLIDTPGVRDFAPALDDLEATGLGFRELNIRAGQCRFQDCQHLREPSCAVQEAVESQAMDARRYESYRRLRRLTDTLREKLPPTAARARRK